MCHTVGYLHTKPCRQIGNAIGRESTIGTESAVETKIETKTGVEITEVGVAMVGEKEVETVIMNGIGLVEVDAIIQMKKVTVDEGTAVIETTVIVHHGLDLRVADVMKEVAQIRNLL